MRDLLREKEEGNGMTVAAYVILADPRQAARMSDMILDCANQNNIKIREWFFDDEVSRVGRLMPRFQSMQAKIQGGFVDSVVFYSIPQMAKCVRIGAMDTALFIAEGITITVPGTPLTPGEQAIMLTSMGLVRRAYIDCEQTKAAARMANRYSSALQYQRAAKKLRREGLEVAEIAKQLGLQPSTARAMIRCRAGRAYWGGGAGRIGRRKGDPGKIYAMWERGTSIREISRMIGLAPATVKTYVEEVLSRRKPPKPKVLLGKT